MVTEELRGDQEGQAGGGQSEAGEQGVSQREARVKREILKTALF